jgi:CBS domain containing-hemolysin-like protein
MVTLFTLFLSIIIASALCSMSEAALLSLPLMRARILNEEKRPNSKDLLFVKEHITDTIASIVFMNNVINIIGSIFVGQMVVVRFGNQWLGVASTIITFTLIIVSEIIPKMIGERYKTNLSLFFAKPIRWLVWLLRPLVFLIIMITKPFVQAPKIPRATEDEIRMMLKLARDEGSVEMDEEVLCNRVFKLNDVRAAQIMKPMEQICALPADKMLTEVKEEIINFRFSRIAVYDKDPLDVVGTVQHRLLLCELAKDNYQAKVRDFMTKPVFVDAMTKADALLEKFQLYQQHLFIVQDAKGKDIGLVTMEDVLEELFGEIYDEKDAVKPKV